MQGRVGQDDGHLLGVLDPQRDEIETRGADRFGVRERGDGDLRVRACARPARARARAGRAVDAADQQDSSNLTAVNVTG
ncbi:hypothetical protein ALMP_41990 [Streptomyces sp. A012304]|nr:hypothetical protein ALMP_41990 [Streptomyces sp. A012304]